jgi:hypothetical protein
LSPPTNVIKDPLNTQRPFYIFTSGCVIVTVQIHSRKKLLEGVKMTTAKWTINKVNEIAKKLASSEA